MSAIIIGKNSFLASHLQQQSSENNWHFLTHDEALAQLDALKKAEVIVNCAFHPDLQDGPYDAEKDVDSAIAQLIRNSTTHYIMLSSRMVYGGAPEYLKLKEDMPPAPENMYGRNKLTIENALQNILPAQRLTILRMSNIFGYEPDRPRFFGQMITSLKNTDAITFDIAPDSQRDFLSVWAWAEYMAVIIKNPQGGVFNIGSGFGTSPQELADILIKQHGKGEVIYTDNNYRGQFIMDVQKLLKAYNVAPYTKSDLCSDIEKVARLSAQ